MNSQLQTIQVQSPEMRVYERFFAFIMGQLCETKQVLAFASEPQYTDLCETAVMTARKVLARRQALAKQLANYIGARYSISELVKKGDAPHCAKTQSLALSQGESIVYRFIQDCVALPQMHIALEQLLEPCNCNVCEKALLEACEQARRDFLLETSSVFDRCDVLEDACANTS